MAYARMSIRRWPRWNRNGSLLLGIAAWLAVVPGSCGAGGNPARWETRISVTQGIAVGAVIGIQPWARDGYDGTGGQGGLPIRPDMTGVFVLLYREEGPGWTGPTGFYGSDFEQTPIPPGGSKTWWDLYLWAQNYVPSPPNRAQLRNGFESHYSPPAGYIGHLVIDKVPDGVEWSGPMEYWLDMTVFNSVTVPIAVVTDPLQGTRMHLTVYDTIPEPSALAALGIGLTVFGLRVKRRH